MKEKLSKSLYVVLAIILIVTISGCAPVQVSPEPANRITVTSQPKGPHWVEILLDDFKPQPYQGESVYFFNRLEGDRGALNNSKVDWGDGQVITTVSEGSSWGGVWMSLNHPIREDLPIDFSTLLPEQILPAHGSDIRSITVHILSGTRGRTFKLELKLGNESKWKEEVMLDGGSQDLHFLLPAFGKISQFVWVLDHAEPGDFVTIDRVSFGAVVPYSADTATNAFVWSYGMLLNNWNPETGLVRDKARDASGEFDAIQATGSLAAATALAEQLGVVERADAVQIVNKISETLLSDIPRYRGLWPHWVKVSSMGEMTIIENTEWSSVDTVIAAIGLLDAQSALGLDTSATEQFLQEIEWNNLVTEKGISHGYTYAGELIPYAWDTFGGESWLVELAYAGATGQVAPLAYSTPPTANGSGFIDELAWLFVEPPPTYWPDIWGTDWSSYRIEAAYDQITYFMLDQPNCYHKLGLFGLSASEVPSPSRVSQTDIYQAFGAGGQFTFSNDGLGLFEAPVVVPHYSAMIASLRPEEATVMWDWLISSGHFSPLTNVESLMFSQDSDCDADTVEWNQLKGSWNLALQTLGWGRYLAERNGEPSILWRATRENPFLTKGYHLLVPAVAWRECEYPNESTTGEMIWRSSASIEKVHGQFSAGYVEYDDVNIPSTDSLYLKLRYSKYSPSSVPIQVYIDDESMPRAEFIPVDQGNWDQFVWTEPIPVGNVESGIHSIKFAADGQQYGVADLDMFILSAETAPTEESSSVTPMTTLTSTTWTYEKESEYPDEETVGQTIQRTNASGLNVHGQFGTTADAPWQAKPGYVKYKNIDIPQTDNLYLKLRYSKYSPSSVPILIYIDDEPEPRSTFIPLDQGEWNNFTWTEPILLGSMGSGVHSIMFSTDGQQYGVADLDGFVLTAESP